MSKLITPILDPRLVDNWQPANVGELAVYWMTFYAKARKAPSSIARDMITLKKYLLPSYGKCPLDQITTRNVEFWFLNLVKDSPLSAKSCNDVLTLFKKLLNDAVRWEFIPQNPLTFIKKIPLPERDMDFWNKTEVQLFLGYWQTRKHLPKMFWAVTLALYTGMRRGEILALQWDSVDFSSGFITVKCSYCKASKIVRNQTKTAKIRRIPISSSLLGFLIQLKKLTGSSGYVVPGCHPDSFLKMFRRMSREAGIKEIRFHDLRHTFASNFLMGGGNIYDLQKLLGHSTVQVTERYTHFIPDHLRGKTEVLGF